MPDIYGIAWRALEQRIAKTRRQSISKKELTEWQLKALQQAIDTWLDSPAAQLMTQLETGHGEQEEA